MRRISLNPKHVLLLLSGTILFSNATLSLVAEGNEDDYEPDIQEVTEGSEYLDEDPDETDGEFTQNPDEEGDTFSADSKDQESDAEVQEKHQDSDNSALDEEWVYESGTWINPAYEDLIDPDSMFGVSSEEENLLFAGNEMREFTTKEEVIEYVRGEYVARNPYISARVNIPSENGTVDWSGFINEIIERIGDHTGNPKEGDYLSFNVYGGGYNYSYSPGSSSYYGMIFISPIYFATAEQEEEVDRKIEQIKQTMDIGNGSEGEIATAIHDYICSHVTYDYTNLNDDSYYLKYSAYAAVVQGTAVCQGYASLCYRLALEYGLDARVIKGTGGPENIAHGWNIIGIDGLYYLEDTTWDAGKPPTYNYYLRGEFYFRGHNADETYLTDEFRNAYPLSQQNYEYPKSMKAVLKGLIATPNSLTINGIGTTRTIHINSYPANAIATDLTVTCDKEGLSYDYYNDELTVTGLKGGDYVLDVSARNGVHVSIPIHVNEDPAEVTEVSISNHYIEVPVSSTMQLKATVSPKDATTPDLIWFSSDSSIAEVTDTGTVFGISPGICNIYAVSEDGNYYDYCEVKVNKGLLYVMSNVGSMALQKGEETTLYPIVYPYDANQYDLEYVSSDPGIVSVDTNGHLKALGEGEAVITVTDTLSGNSAKCYVNVYDFLYYPVTSISIDTTETAINIGDTLLLNASALPEDSSCAFLMWSSSNPNVARVNGDGLVTAINAGDAVIRAVAYHGKWMVECHVTVIDPDAEASGIKVREVKTISPGSTYTIIPEYIGSLDAVTSFTAYSENSEVAEVISGGTIRAKKEGNALIRINESNYGFYAYCLIKVAPDADVEISVTSGGNNPVNVVALYSPDLDDGEISKDIKSSMNQALYNASITNNGSIADALFGEVPLGTYKLAVYKEGYLVKIEEIDVDGSEQNHEVKLRMLGDINNDGRIGGMDVVLMRQLNLKRVPSSLKEEDIKAADINGDGKISGMDVVLIRNRNVHRLGENYKKA